MPFLTLPRALALCAVLSGALASTARAQGPPCSASVAPDSQPGGSNVTYSVTAGQSFTVPCSGQVASVVLQPRSFELDDFRGSGYSLRVRILNAAGTTLGTSAQNDQYYPGSTTTFDLSAANVLVTAGTTYRWELFSDRASAENFALYLLDRASTDVYAAGQLYTNGTADATRDARGWTVNVAAALPVELVSFVAQANGRAVRLSWTTASETNNAGFVVERRAGDGAGAWADASGLVAGHGTTTERHDYAFEVTGLTAGRHTFRLRQTDTDGTVHHSDEATVEVGVEGEGRATLLGQRAVRVETGAAQVVTVAVYDVLGRAVAVQRVDVDGTREVALPAALPSGTYVVRVAGERFAETLRLVVR